MKRGRAITKLLSILFNLSAAKTGERIQNPKVKLIYKIADNKTKYRHTLQNQKTQASTAAVCFCICFFVAQFCLWLCFLTLQLFFFFLQMLCMLSQIDEDVFLIFFCFFYLFVFCGVLSSQYVNAGDQNNSNTKRDLIKLIDKIIGIYWIALNCTGALDGTGVENKLVI